MRSSGLPLVAYSPLLGGAYVRPDRPLGPEFDHAGTPRRLAALHAVASETGATANQVVLAWLMGGELPVIPLVGASSVAQLEDLWARWTWSFRPGSERGWIRQAEPTRSLRACAHLELALPPGWRSPSELALSRGLALP